jgi:Tfp pilus assembly protein PilO
MTSPNGTRPWKLWWVDAAGIGVCLLASAVGYGALVSPYLQQRSAAANLSGELEIRQKKVKELDGAVDVAQDRLAAAQQQLKTGAIHLESAAHVNKRIAEVTEFFAGCNLHVDDVQTGRVSDGPQYDVVPITIVGRGAYPQCAKLLHGLCAKYPDMSVLRFDLSGGPNEQAEMEKFRFELFWYAAPSSTLPKVGSGATGGGAVTPS